MPEHQNFLDKVRSYLPVIMLGAGLFSGFYIGREHGYRTAQKDLIPIIEKQERTIDAHWKYLDLISRISQGEKSEETERIKELKREILQREKSLEAINEFIRKHDEGE